MKTLILALALTGLVGCASIPSHCIRNGALAAGLAAGAGYVVAENSGKRHVYTNFDPITGDAVSTSYYMTGSLYGKRGMVAATTGATTGAITMAICTARANN